MLIHLSKPGGQRIGPYTLEQIIQDLAVSKYSDTDYWAWHEGLTEWVPLYLLPGIAEETEAEPGVADAAQPEDRVGKPPNGASSSTAVATSDLPSPATPQAPPRPSPSAPDLTVSASEPGPDMGRQVSAGMPMAALEQIFLFTTGDGRSAWQSATVSRMLQEIIGEDPAALRVGVPRDVVAHCAISELLKPDGSISDTVWRAMAGHRPTIVQQARERLYRVCVRTFRVEGDAVVALVLFYNKQKL